MESHQLVRRRLSEALALLAYAFVAAVVLGYV
jgi:hypothetical protein